MRTETTWSCGCGFDLDGSRGMQWIVWMIIETIKAHSILSPVRPLAPGRARQVKDT
jgi:hypothetical protein